LTPISILYCHFICRVNLFFPFFPKSPLIHSSNYSLVFWFFFCHQCIISDFTAITFWHFCPWGSLTTNYNTLDLQELVETTTDNKNLINIEEHMGKQMIEWINGSSVSFFTLACFIFLILDKYLRKGENVINLSMLALAETLSSLHYVYS
jgi:hypothetical protein